MFLIINNFNNDNLILSEKQKNNILVGSDFYRLYYSDEFCTFNGVYFNFMIKNIHIQKYFNKIKCVFDTEINKTQINNILNIEKNILNKFEPFLNKKKEYIIEEQIKQGFIKIFMEKQIKYGKYNNINLILKISGIWVQNDKYGLTFRFFISNL